MRISCDEKDPGYAQWIQIGLSGHDMHAVKIFLDDVEQKSCVMADDALGVIKRAKLDAAGYVFAIDNKITMEEIHGVVRIEIPKPAAN